MNNITEHGLYTGGVPSSRDGRDFQYEGIASASVPFDWNKGFDIETVVGKLPVKDQGQSLSCGGQAVSQYGGVIEAQSTGTLEERSAKFEYAPVACPGGGSQGRDLMDRGVNVGFGTEALTSSYINGNPPTEAFMTNVADITPQAIQTASGAKSKSYVKIVDTTNIDTIAQAIRDNYGILMGVNGEDNGSWLSNNPQKPSKIVWRHWVFACKARIYNGTKQIGFINSWGKTVGDNGVQWINEDYFTSGNVFEAWTMMYNAPVVNGFKHYFGTDLQRGQFGDEVKLLQQALRLEGLFNYPVDTGTYGVVTAASVYAFQCKYNIAPLTRWIYRGFYFGPATRAVMNSLYNK